MGSGASRLLSCVRPPPPPVAAPLDGGAGDAGFEPGPLDEALGHSFCYTHSRSSSLAGDAAAFRTISGAAVSANSSTPIPVYGATAAAASGFESSSSFSALPLQLSGGGAAAASGPLDRGFFLSGPIERGALSGPLEPVPFSGPLVKRKARGLSRRFRKPSFLLRRSISEKNRPWVVPLGGGGGGGSQKPDSGDGVEWAHGRAGEDRVHVVVSEEHRWLFVGIYDGFNGPEAPDFLVSHLYPAVFRELRGIFYEDSADDDDPPSSAVDEVVVAKPLWQFLADGGDVDGELDFSGSGRFALSLAKLRYGIGSWRKDAATAGGRKVWFPRWSYASEEKAKDNDTKVVAADRTKSGHRRRPAGPVADHQSVLAALSRALESTEQAYLEVTDRAMDCNPELALMGSCLLVVLMRDEDVYVMNLGDSRAIVAHCRPQGGEDSMLSSARDSLEQVGTGEGENGEQLEIEVPGRAAVELEALQLSTDHSTCIEEEVLRIKHEHPNDDRCIVNDRVKGRLKVTRAFGAGYLKQAKWNSALLEMFRNEFIGTAPYISCTPSLCHHKLGANDQFLVLSSDGLYQYLSNEEVVLHVENFMERFPDGDPAQSLIEELLFRAAKKAGMEFYELLDIPQGDRRKYHDDVTVMVISLEGRIWKSSGKYV